MPGPVGATLATSGRVLRAPSCIHSASNITVSADNPLSVGTRRFVINGSLPVGSRLDSQSVSVLVAWAVSMLLTSAIQ